MSNKVEKSPSPAPLGALDPDVGACVDAGAGAGENEIQSASLVEAAVRGGVTAGAPVAVAVAVADAGAAGRAGDAWTVVGGPSNISQESEPPWGAGAGADAGACAGAVAGAGAGAGAPIISGSSPSQSPPLVKEAAVVDARPPAARPAAVPLDDGGARSVLPAVGAGSAPVPCEEPCTVPCAVAAGFLIGSAAILIVTAPPPPAPAPEAGAGAGAGAAACAGA